ncbi:MAG TPA: amino acid adenylation domain-containing protein, partial [Thermoanaerobaculia bacterium]
MNQEVKPISPELRELLLLKLKSERKRQAGIGRLERTGERPSFPLSFAQQRLWFLDQYISRRAAYNVPLVLELEGALEVGRLQAALGEVVRRHEILRTTCSAAGVQIIHPPEPLPLQLADWSEEAGAESWVEAMIREEVEEPFDLERGPVLSARLHRINPSKHVLLVNIHHIATDGWSTAILRREIQALYQASCAREPADLPELPIQYADFAVWQRSWLTGSVRERLLSYWTAKLANAPLLDLPFDRPRPKRQSFAGGRVGVAISRETGEALSAAGRHEQVTVFAVLLAAFEALAYRYTGQKDIVVGAPFANRSRPEVENLIGFFVNTLPLRTAVDGDIPVRELFRRVHETVREAQEHQDLPFELIVDEMGVARDPSHPPIYQVVFNFQKLSGEPAGGAAPVHFGLSEITTGSAKFDLTLAIWESEGVFAGDLVYDARLFDGSTVERLATHFQNVLAGMLQAPHSRVGEIEILSPEERLQLLGGRYGRGARELSTSFRPGALLTGLFETQVETRPDAVAVTAEGDPWTYDALNRRANRLAHRLIRLGVGPEVKVGLCYERSAELIVAILGILKAGGVYVPLDPSYPPERLRFIAEDAGLALILTADRHLEQLPRSIARDTGWPQALDGPETDPPASACPGNGAYVIYTSGSTGKPKGVIISHRNVIRLFQKTLPVFNFDASDVWTLFHSYAFDFSVWEIWGALLFGGRLVIVPHWVSRSPADFRHLLVSEKVTVLNQSPSAFRQLLHEKRDGEEDLSSLCLRYIVFGAEALDWQILEPWFRERGDAASLVNMYGITETTVHVTHRGIDPQERPLGSPIGQAIDDLDLYLRDDDGNLVPIGVPGEIYVGGPGLSRGYLHRPDLTAERFLPHPSSQQPGERLYKSGDRARFLADGEMIFLGRNDDQVKIRGFRIELGEIQAAICALPEVRDALVLALKNPEAEDFLAAYVISSSDGGPDVRQLRDALTRSLPDYMVPARFVFLERFPMTAHGKLDRGALPDTWEVRQRLGEGEGVPLRSVTEEALAAIWSEALGGGNIGREDNFFALGGDSILSIRVLGLARSRGIHFSLQELFQHQTVKALAREVARGRALEDAPATYEPFSLLSPEVRRKLPEDVQDAYPLSKLQLGMLYEMRLTPELLPYHNVDSMTIRGALDRDAFLAAVRMLVSRHPVFRTSIHVGEYGEPLQLVHRQASLAVEWHDLRALAAADQWRIVDEHVAKERGGPFDLKTPGLLRFAIHRLDDDLFQFSLTENHTILDGWSLTSAIAEVFDRHFRIVNEGDRQPLPAPKLLYGEFIAEERRLTASEEAQTFWRQQLADFSFREIPKWPGELSGEEALNEVMWKLPRECMEGLRRTARESQVPLKSVFLAAHVKVLSLLLGTADVVVGMQSNGRPEVEGGDEVYGLYLNAMPLRIRMQGGTWKDLVHQVFRAEWEALPHRAFPMAVIQGMRGGAPLFEVFFNFVSFHSIEKVVRSRQAEVVGESRFVEPNHFPLLAGFNLDPVSGEMTVVLQSARRDFPRAQLLAFRSSYDAALEGLAAASAGAGETPAARHDGLARDATLGIDEPVEYAIVTAAMVSTETAWSTVYEAPAYEAPATPTEEILAAVWAEILCVDQVSRSDGFFNLGGDSIFSLRAVAAAEERGLFFSLQKLYEHATLRDLAREIDLGTTREERAEPTQPFALAPDELRRRVPDDVVDIYPMATLQLGMLYHMELDPELLPYHNVDSGLFRARLEKKPFLRAVQLVVDRHPILRTGFHLKSYGKPLQLVHRTATMPIVWEDLRGLDPTEQEKRIRGYLEGERVQLFDLTRPPLLRYAVHLLSDSMFRFSMTENHILLDGWSFNAILAEVFTFYFRLLEGEEIDAPPPPPEPPYREFIRLEQTAIRAPESRSFWRERLAGCPHLRIAGAGGGEDGSEGEVFKTVEVTFSGEEAAVYERWARRWMVPVKTVFLAAHLKVLSLLASAEEIVTGLVCNGRPEASGGSEVYGLFLNTVPLRIRVAAGDEWSDLVVQVFDAERSILPHRRVPLAVIQSDHGSETLCEVMFNYISFHSLRSLLGRKDFQFVGEIRSASPTHYPLAVSFNRNPVDGELLVILQAGTRKISRPQLEAVGELYRRVLASLAAGHAAPTEGVPAGVLAVQPPVDFRSTERLGDVPRAAARTAPFELPAALTEGLRSLAEEGGGTLETVLLAAFRTLVGRSSSQADLTAGIELASSLADASAARCDVIAALVDGAGGLRGRIEGRGDLFDATTLLRLAGHWRTLLTEVVAGPDRELADLPLLSDAERHQILVEWNGEATLPPDFDSLHHAIERQVERTPEAVALVFEESVLTYVELNARANRLARRLQDHGVGPEVPVAIAAERSLELVIGLLGILKAGGAYVPFDPSYPEQRLASMLEELLGHASGTVLLAQAETREIAPSHRDLPRVVLEAEAPAGDGWTRNLEQGSSPDHLAYVIYTSGSTGKPKGVMNTHRGILNRLFWCQRQYGLTAADRVLQKTPMSFDVSVWELFWPLVAGAELVLAQPGGHRDSGYLAALIARRGITVLHFVPSMLEAFLREPDLAGCGSLRAVIASGEALTPELARRFAERLGGSGVELHNLYGPTEAAIDVTAHRCEPTESQVPIGRPVANTRIHLLDRDHRPVPLGVPGQLMIGGVQLARGYLGQPARTAESFLPDPLSWEPGARLYQTGDLARYRPDGEIVFLGRIDHQIKLRGFRIELGEIESVLRSHPGVREAVVKLQQAGRRGPQLVACLVPVPGVAPEAAELRSFLLNRLPEHMVPAAFALFDAFPLTPNGKIDRLALEVDVEREPVARVLSRTPVEEILAGLWAEVLDLPAIGSEDHFFELGGHSLLAMQLNSRIREALQVELPLRALFEKPTLAALASHLETIREEGGALTVPPVTRRSGSGPAPVSFSQERLWFLDRFQPESSQYNIAKAVRLYGAFDIAALADALRRLEERHESLRTTFLEEGGRPLQRVTPATGDRNLLLVDLSAVAAGMHAGAAAPGAAGRPVDPLVLRLASEEAARPFDLARGPLHRVVLLRLGPGEHVLLFTIHHILSDAWSLEIWSRELAALYTACRDGRPSPLAPLAVQYADYAVWQREWLVGEVLERQMGWWREHLTGAPSSLELPVDRPRPRVRSWRGATQRDLSFRPELMEALTALSQRHGTTHFMTLLAAFGLLLHRYSGQTDIVIGLPIANRNRREVEGVIGLFVNTMALRTDLSGDPTITELLGRVRDSTLAAYQHQELPFEKLVAELQPERDLSRTPLFQVMFVFHHAPADPAIQGMSYEPLVVESGTAKFDLLLSLTREGGELTGEIEYDRDLFDAATIRRFTGHLASMLEDFVAHPDKRLAEVSLLLPSEETQLLREWNGPSQPASGRLLHRRFEAQVERTPEAAALVFGETRLTYRELDRRANRLAHRLVRRGVGPDIAVGLYLERSLEIGVGVLGVLKAGGACVPLDPSYPAERLRFMIENSAGTVVLTQQRLAAQLRELAGDGIDILEVDGDLPLPGEAPLPETPPTCQGAIDQRLYVIYTSGSTGRPKGVELPHRVLDNLVDVFLAQCRPGARTLQLAPLSFDVSFMEMFTAWLSGGSVHVVPEEVRRDVPSLAHFLEAQRIETAVFPVVLLHLVAEEILAGRALPLDLRDVISTGEQLVITDVVRGLFADPRFGACRLHNHYGPSETHVVTTWTMPPDPRSWVPRPAIGRPLTNVRTYVADPYQRLQPPGVHGELLLGGLCLAQGYLGRPEMTAERFLPDPWAGQSGGEPGDRVYRTGDLVRLQADGVLEYLGRIDHQVKLRGFRIELGEIESVLRSHLEVDEAVVLLRTDRGGPQLVAYVVAAGPAVPEAAELRRFLSEKLPDYMVPAAYVSLERLPVNANGKIDRVALPPPPQPESAGGAAPRTSHEELLAGIWSSILSLPRVGLHEDFFALGGHSLLATQVVSRIRSILGVEVPLRAIFEAPTIALLSERTEQALRANLPMLPALEPRSAADRSLDASVPLSFSQRRLWFLDQLQPESPAYNIPLALRIEGRLDATALTASLVEIVRRHESLRTTFRLEGGEPVQIVSRTEELRLARVDLAALPADEREREAVRLAREESLRPFALSHGLLLRSTLLELGAGGHAMLLTMHHIVSDGWSMGILVRELGALYGAFSRGLPSPLPELPLQYTDFALWQQRWMGGEILEVDLRYWQRQLHALMPLDLPMDRPRSPSVGQAGASCLFEWPGELADGLAELARREGVTRFMALLAAFQLLLYRYTGQLDVVVGTPIAGRNLLRTEDLIGFFINTLVLRADLSVSRADDPLSARQLLARVRETSLEAYAHQNLPFEKLVEALQPERDLSRTPLFDVMFALHNQPLEPLALEGLRFEPFFWESGVARFDLSWSFEEIGGSLRGGVVYRTALFDATTIQRMTEHLAHLLEGMLTAPDRDLGEIPLLSAEERQQLLAEWNDTRGTSPSEPSLARLFEAQVRQTPEAVSVVFEETTLSYDELNRRANRLARRLRKLGVGPEVPVAIAAERSLELVIGLLGILKAGGAYVPLDPSYPEKRLALMLEELMERAPESVLLTQKALPELSPASALVGSPRPILHRIFLDAEE